MASTSPPPISYRACKGPFPRRSGVHCCRGASRRGAPSKPLLLNVTISAPLTTCRPTSRISPLFCRAGGGRPGPGKNRKEKGSLVSVHQEVERLRACQHQSVTHYSCLQALYCSFHLNQSAHERASAAGAFTGSKSFPGVSRASRSALIPADSNRLCQT